MATEIEVKFLEVDFDTIRRTLQAQDARLAQPMRLMRRALFDYPDMRLQKANWGRLRVRDEGDKVTVTYKSGDSDEYSEEIETTIGSFEDMCNLFKAIGLQQIAFQESKRETWHYKDVEVVLDEWPWLKPYIEIEGPSEQSIKDCAEVLDFEWPTAKRGNVDVVYRLDYPGMKPEETINAMGELRFAGSLPDWLHERKSV
jgi:adenylate cyclase class 2